MTFDLIIPKSIISEWKLKEGNYKFSDQLYGKKTSTLKVTKEKSSIKIKINPLESFILKLKN